MAGRAVLVCPPMAKGSEVDPAIPVLAGHLRKRGIEAWPVDANLTFQESLLATDKLSTYALDIARHGTDRAGTTSAKRAANNIGRSLRRLKSEEGYRDYNIYRGSIGELTEGFRLASKALGVTLSISDFNHPQLSPLSSEDLAKVARTPETIGTAEHLRATLPEILGKDPAIIGISLSYLSQALHGFALAGLLRKAGFEGLLLLGGGLVNSWGPRISRDSPIFEIFDGVITGLGEEPLTQIALAEKIVDAPGVMAPAHGIWNRDEAKNNCAPSFEPFGESLRWNDYLSPSPILPVSASRGCYWARCAFCPEASGDRQPYRIADAKILGRRILDEREKSGLGWVHFTDNALSPSHMRGFAEVFKESGVNWYGFARLEKQMAEPGFMKEIYKGGCRMLQLGIESATPRLLEMMGKGIDLERTSTIVKNAKEAGIRVYGYFLFGLPTETREEALSTVEWIRAHSGHIDFLNLSLMNMPRGGEMEEKPGDFGLSAVAEKDDTNDLSLYTDYKGDKTLDRRELRRILGMARKDALVRKLILQTPPGFSANHAAFIPLP